MKRNVDLYIADVRVDLEDDSLILFNYTRENLDNPTVVKNSYSHKVELKGTSTNNKLFGSIFRLDRQTLYSDKYNGVFFDPMRKTPFQIFDETGAVLESGYVKLDSVKKDGGSVSYSITLYGGLGSFFYGLTYNDDGSKKTLADLKYKTIDGSWAETLKMNPAADTVNEAWLYLADPENYDVNIQDYDCWNVVNFAPAYNGLPKDFDSSKAIYKNKGLYVNVPLTISKDGVTYAKKEGTDSILMSFSNDHTEWEVNDLRWYLQRPVISIKSIVEAIANPDNNGGFSVELDPIFFSGDHEAYRNAWLTLPMIKTEDRSSDEFMQNVLKATLSPAEYLLSYVKMFGLVFKYDMGLKKVSIMTKNTFYQEYKDVVDLSERINKSEPIEIVPVTTKTKWYQFGGEVMGQFAKEYEQDFGIPYGIKKINTGYEFDVKVEELTKSIVFKDAVDVMENNRMFTSGRFRRYSTQAFAQDFLLPAYEQVTSQLWGTITNEDGESEEQSIDVDVTATATSFEYDNPDHPFGDWLPKVQLHDEGNKEIDGSNVLLFFCGVKSTPNYQEKNGYNVFKKYWLTEDTEDMITLNGGSCWDLSGTARQLTALPSFRRVYTTVDGTTILQSFEWGNPLARAVPMIQYQRSVALYDLWWETYLSDLYSDNTRVMKCMVNLRGLPVGQSLLQRFFWYGGTIWVLNKINNYSITTYDDVECEFIKVNDMNNYKQAQIEW